MSTYYYIADRSLLIKYINALIYICLDQQLGLKQIICEHFLMFWLIGVIGQLQLLLLKLK